LVEHRHHAERTRAHDYERGNRLLHRDEGVERVVVVTERPRNEAVVGRPDHRRVQDTVDAQQPGLLAKLVVDLAALGDLDDDRKLVRRPLAGLSVVPSVAHRRFSA
jgi:hypothetical protein